MNSRHRKTFNPKFTHRKTFDGKNGSKNTLRNVRLVILSLGLRMFSRLIEYIADRVIFCHMTQNIIYVLASQ